MAVSPGPVGPNQTGLADLDDLGVVRLIVHLVRHVFLTSVGKGGRHPKLLFPTHFHHRLARRNGKPTNSPCVAVLLTTIRRPVANPLQDRFIVCRVSAQSLTSSMRNLSSGLDQKETFLRLLQIDPGLTPPQRLRSQNLVGSSFDHPLIIILGIKGIGRELEPAPTFDTAVTLLIVTAALGEDPSHIACKAERPRTAAVLDSNLGLVRPAFELGCQHHFPIFKGNDPARLCQPSCPGVGKPEATLSGEVTLQAIRVKAHQQKSLGGARTCECDFSRL